MASRIAYLVLIGLWIGGLWWGLDVADRRQVAPMAVPMTQVDWATFFAVNIRPDLPVADEFDAPLRPPDGEGAIVSFPFREAGHLGEDWTTAKGDAAVGEPVYSVADGWVSVAQDNKDAWGKVILVCHRMPENRWPPFVETMYSQLNSIEVKAGDFVKRGQRIGTVGNANGMYSIASGGAGAHLHWEVRQTVGLGTGPGFQDGATGWLGPSEFVVAHRGARANRPLLDKVLRPEERAGWGTDY